MSLRFCERRFRHGNYALERVGHAVKRALRVIGGHVDHVFCSGISLGFQHVCGNPEPVSAAKVRRLPSTPLRASTNRA